MPASPTARSNGRRDIPREGLGRSGPPLQEDRSGVMFVIFATVGIDPASPRPVSRPMSFDSSHRTGRSMTPGPGLAEEGRKAIDRYDRVSRGFRTTPQTATYTEVRSR
ncbi:hypothetical protein Sfum_3221 [Syntrophobacter fumaroxidans MPOB]|uniref:Uncharacterized protein n=1 Tax=Syntrophobacter fumaroxidans (strain DSM 10017 / MPOB) TaxID=335543 RepID=A0LN92_SYNFM|nr:hypothetical protein Sfum_3221 [Syntrophobacter fumaroxidans MPOB]